MSDTLRAEIDRYLAGDNGPVSRLGYFTAPFRGRDGDFADKVIKVYRSPGSPQAMARLARAHDDYLDVLRGCGVTVPDTRFQAVTLDRGEVPVVVQQGLPDDTMMRPMMMQGEAADAVALLETAGRTIARFWTRVQDDPRRIGFHPSIRNFAVLDGEAVFFDTFPPLIDYSRDEMGKLLLTFSDKALMRWVGPLIQSRVTAIQDEWYSPSETLVGMVGSACRLRPHDAGAFLDWGRDFAGREMPGWRDEIVAGLDAPPRLSGLWTGMRKALGLQGAPNI